MAITRHQRFWLRPAGVGVYSVVVPAAGVSDRAEPPTLEDFKQRLRTIANSLRDTGELYRVWAHSGAAGKQRDVAREHQRILEATLARDVDRAADELSSHIQGTTNSRVIFNDVHDNAGGILVTDDMATTHGNEIAFNRVRHNTPDWHNASAF